MKNVIKLFKAIICFCLFLITTCLTAQNSGNYKYIATPFDSILPSRYLDMLEIDNHYYVLSNGFYDDYDNNTILPTESVTIFDKDFNPIEHIKLSTGDVKFAPLKFFYERNTFYIFGSGNLIGSELWGLCFAKFDKNFNLVQPVSLYGYYFGEEEYSSVSILKNQKKEFIVQLSNWFAKDSSRLMHINNKGEVLQDVLVKALFGNKTILEMDSNYVTVFWGDIGLFNKDSLEKCEYVPIYTFANHLDGSAVVVNNHVIIDAEDHILYPECGIDPASGLPRIDLERTILFLDSEFKIKDSLTFGTHCRADIDGQDNMHYINPDSIYYAYKTGGSMGMNTISIACFSSEGKLQFDHILDLPISEETDRYILFCRALTNGGALIGGIEFNTSVVRTRGYLIYYHPNKDVSSVKEYATNAERQIFPNPARSQFTITHTENASLQLYNTVGQEVLHTQSTDENTIINVSTLPQGLYVLKVVKDGAVKMYKVVVSR